MVNGMTVNGLGEVSAMNDVTNNANSSLLGLGKQLTHYLILGTHFATSFPSMDTSPPSFFSFLFTPIKASCFELLDKKKESW